MTTITTRKLNSIRPKLTPIFIRDNKVTGFGVKVNPSGSIKFFAEVRHEGKSTRKTLGEHPILSVSEARSEATSFINEVRQGNLINQKTEQTLGQLFEQYLSTTKLKPNTIKNYNHVVLFYLADWLNKPITQITKQRVEAKFYQIRDTGISGGKPTLSQVIATMRYLSALMNYAMADETIESNPVQVLKQKRISRSIVKRTSYLPQNEARKVLDSLSTHPVEIAIALMLFTGLRKNEALSLRWEDISGELIRISDTKNHREHLIPITEQIHVILGTIPRSSSPYLFPSPINKNTFIKDVRPALKRVIERTGITFRCHDLRRTFATRASEVGIDYLMIKRLLNHKTNDITAQYIQWDSKQNLEKMKEALEKITY